MFANEEQPLVQNDFGNVQTKNNKKLFVIIGIVAIIILALIVATITTVIIILASSGSSDTTGSNNTTTSTSSSISISPSISITPSPSPSPLPATYEYSFAPNTQWIQQNYKVGEMSSYNVSETQPFIYQCKKDQIMVVHQTNSNGSSLVGQVLLSSGSGGVLSKIQSEVTSNSTTYQNNENQNSFYMITSGTPANLTDIFQSVNIFGDFEVQLADDPLSIDYPANCTEEQVYQYNSNQTNDIPIVAIPENTDIYLSIINPSGDNIEGTKVLVIENNFYYQTLIDQLYTGTPFYSASCNGYIEQVISTDILNPPVSINGKSMNAFIFTLLTQSDSLEDLSNLQFDQFQQSNQTSIKDCVNEDQRPGLFAYNNTYIIPPIGQLVVGRSCAPSLLGIVTASTFTYDNTIALIEYTPYHSFDELVGVLNSKSKSTSSNPLRKNKRDEGSSGTVNYSISPSFLSFPVSVSGGKSATIDWDYSFNYNAVPTITLKSDTSNILTPIITGGIQLNGAFSASSNVSITTTSEVEFSGSIYSFKVNLPRLYVPSFPIWFTPSIGYNVEAEISFDLESKISYSLTGQSDQVYFSYLVQEPLINLLSPIKIASSSVTWSAGMGNFDYKIVPSYTTGCQATTSLSLVPFVSLAMYSDWVLAIDASMNFPSVSGSFGIDSSKCSCETPAFITDSYGLDGISISAKVIKAFSVSGELPNTQIEHETSTCMAIPSWAPKTCKVAGCNVTMSCQFPIQYVGGLLHCASFQLVPVSNCFCYQDVLGNNIAAQSANCSEIKGCSSNNDCQKSEVCVTETCCGGSPACLSTDCSRVSLPPIPSENVNNEEELDGNNDNDDNNNINNNNPVENKDQKVKKTEEIKQQETGEDQLMDSEDTNDMQYSWSFLSRIAANSDSSKNGTLRYLKEDYPIEEYLFCVNYWSGDTHNIPCDSPSSYQCGIGVVYDPGCTSAGCCVNQQRQHPNSVFCRRGNTADEIVPCKDLQFSQGDNCVRAGVVYTNDVYPSQSYYGASDCPDVYDALGGCCYVKYEDSVLSYLPTRKKRSADDFAFSLF